MVRNKIGFIFCLQLAGSDNQRKWGNIRLGLNIGTLIIINMKYCENEMLLQRWMIGWGRETFIFLVSNPNYNGFMQRLKINETS